MTDPTPVDILTLLNDPAGTPPNRIGQDMVISCSAWDATASTYLAVGYKVHIFKSDGIYPTENLVWFRREGQNLTKLTSPTLPAVSVSFGEPPNDEPTYSAVYGVAWTPDGQYLAVAFAFRLLLYRRVNETLTLVHTYPVVGSGGGYTATEPAMAWDSTGTYLVCNLSEEAAHFAPPHVLKRTGDTLQYIYHYAASAYGAISVQWVGTKLYLGLSGAGPRALQRTGDTFTQVASRNLIGSGYTGGLTVTPDAQHALLLFDWDSGGSSVVPVSGVNFADNGSDPGSDWETVLARHLWYSDRILLDPTGTYVAAAGAEIYEEDYESWYYGPRLRVGLKWARRDGTTYTPLPSPAPGPDDSYGVAMSWGGGLGALYLVSGGNANPGTGNPTAPASKFGFRWYFVGSPSQLQVRLRTAWEYVGTAERPLAVRTAGGWQYQWPGAGIPLRVRTHAGWEEVLS